MTASASPEWTSPERTRLVVLGHPVGHSLSPPMQNAALREMGLADRWTYDAIDVTPAEFPALVRKLADEGYKGANVTLPHKVAALALSDEATSQARRIGAANTLTFNDDGTISAANSDAPGFLDSLGQAAAGRRAVVLGAGGTSRAVVCALTDAGAEVLIWNRTYARAVALAEEFGARALSDREWDQLSSTGDFDIVTNTTSIGLRQPGERFQGEEDLKALGIRGDNLNESHTVVDLVYGTEPTALALAARQAGAKFVDGLEILILQGAISLNIWTGMEVPIDAMRDAIREATGEQAM